MRAALIQMAVEPGEREANLQRARERVLQARASGAELALLPEAMPLGWTDSSALEMAEAVPGGKTVQLLCELARDSSIYLCSGIIERAGETIYNSAVLIDPHGRMILHHRKIHELEIGHDLYATGSKLEVVHTRLGTIGLIICADGFARQQPLTRALGYMGADYILAPSAWAVPPDHDNAREPYGRIWTDNFCPVASDFRLWILACSNVGPIRDGAWAGRSCIGCSMIIDPTGQLVVQGPYGAEADTILYVDAPRIPRPARGTGWERVQGSGPWEGETERG